MSRSGYAFIMAVCGAFAGCTGAPERSLAPDAGGRSYARLTVVATIPREGPASLAVSGRLLRYRNLDADSAQILAGAPPYEAAPPSSCELIDDETLLDLAMTSSSPDASVRLLDAGEVLVRAAGQAVRVAPRYVPEVLPFVSGVAYAAEVVADPSLDSDGGDVYVSAFGGEDVGAFSATAELPAVPALGAVTDPQRGSPLEVTWEGRSNGSVDIVVTRDPERALRCRVPDQGKFTIPARALAPLWDIGHSPEAVLSVERGLRSPLSAPGIDAGDVVVVARDAVTLRAP